MIYSKIQKIISVFLLFIFFFGQITGLSFLGLFSNQAFAINRDFHDLVSIIVDEKTYDKLDSEIDRYAEDIQQYLDNTKVVILPIKNNTTAFQISSLNESLFYEGYKAIKNVDFESRLVGTILIGDFPLPILSNNGKVVKSIIPYVDFEDKRYIYNPKTKLFEANSDNINGLKAEIWEGVISPNTGSFDGNIEEIKKFLDKDHDFYKGENLFDKEKGVLNGKNGESISDSYKPYVFYFDEIREQKSVSPISYKGYEAFQENKEDILYHRYTNELAEKIKSEIMDEAQEEIKGLIEKLPSTNKLDTSIEKAKAMLIADGNIEAANNISEEKIFDSLETTELNDISTKLLIEKSTKKFIEIFNRGTISDFRKNVHSAGRYNPDDEKVNVDLIPATITILDFISDRVIKAANNDIEAEIDKTITGSIAKKITNIPTKIENRVSYFMGTCGDKITEYENFYFGKKASNLEKASDCTVYRGSFQNGGQVVEATRGLNTSLAQDDVLGNYNGGQQELCKTKESAGHKGQGMYGGVSPLNFDTSSISEMKLNSYDLKKSVLPLFDIKGSKKVDNISKIPSPKDCLDINWIRTKEEKKSDDGTGWCHCDIDYQILSKPTHCGKFWTCKTTNDNYSSKPSGEIKGTKSIDSYMFHKSPTIVELNKQLQAKITPNLPIDRDRYIDFFSLEVDAQTKAGEDSYKKIFYPQLFRLKGKTKEEIEEKLEELLDKKSEEINAIKAGSIDLKEFLKNKIVKTVEINGEEKKFSYFDFLVFSIYWNNLKNSSAKYKFVIENYLSDQVGGNNFDFVLAGNKKLYEIAYLGAHGDAQNMYIKMDIKNKGKNPFGDLMGKYSQFNLDVLGLGVIQHENLTDFNKESEFNDDGNYKCAPPEGVPIWEWIPAVFCRLKSLLPPELGSEWVCGEKLMDEEDEEDVEYEDKEELKERLENDKKTCTKDEDKNGINDCLERQLKKLEIKAIKTKYSFNEVGKIISVTQDDSGKRVLLDSVSNIDFSLEKITDLESGKVVFDASKDNFNEKLNIINQYVFFTPTTVRSNFGKAKTMFSTKNKEADIELKATLTLKPNNFLFNKIDLNKVGENYQTEIGDKESITTGNTQEIKITSNILKLKIREEHLFIDNRFVGEDGSLELVDGKIEASDKTNIYLFAGNKDFEDFSGLNKNSVILKLKSFSKNNVSRNINFPILIKIKKKNGTVIQKETINYLSDLKKLASISKSGEYILEIRDHYGFNISYNFEISPSVLDHVNINLGSSIISSDSGVSSNLISLYDRFGNIVSGDIFDYKIKILGDSVVFNNTGKKELSFSNFEGYKAFRLKSTGKEGISKILVEIFKDGTKLKTASKNIKVIDKLFIDLSFDHELEVGSKQAKAHLIFKDKNGNKLTDLNSRVYLSGVSNYLKQKTAYTEINSGEAFIDLETKSKASENLVMNFRVEGFSQVFSKKIKILPGKAMSISLSPLKTKLEADPSDFTQINVSLRDIYNNIVYTDSSSKVSVLIKDEYKDLIKAHNNIEEITLRKGVGSFRFDATEYPGNIYLKFKVNKNLEDNEFIVGEGEKSKIIRGLSENAIKLESYYFWKKSKIVGKKYNALYTTLLGAEYGDFTQRDYLASGMLFDKNNRSLAVTSLISSPYNSKDILNITNNGILQKISYPGDLSQDLTINLIKDINDKYYLDLFNEALNIHIGKIYLNFDDLDINDSLYDKVKKENKIYFSDFGITTFNSIFASTEGKLNILLNTTHNNFIVYIDSPAYNLRKIELGNNKKALAISYNDPFDINYSLNDFAKESFDTYENFEKNGNLGWKAGNKTLLEFAAGVGAGEASRKYMGPLVVTLGDPVVSLKKIKKTSHEIEKKYDSTIGEKLNEEEILGYKVLDYNSDNKQDIITIGSNGFINLLENKNSGIGFLNQKHLARIFDLGNVDLLSTGDFSGDSYDDIFFVDKKGRPNILDNNKKDFVRVDLSKNFDLHGRIISAKAFDMDADGIDDIVTLDDSGHLNIFYGNKNTTDFTKKTIYNEYGLKIEDTPTKDNAAIYFDGLDSDVNTEDFPILKDLMFETLSYDLTTNRDVQNYFGVTDFLKSTFAEFKGVSILRTFKDRNGGFLTAGDIVDVEVKIKNISGHKLTNIVYLEDVLQYFDINYDSIKVSKEVNIRKNLGKYEFYLDKFELNNNEELTLTYSVKSKALIYKYIKVGLFEKGEVGDDEYGDIIVKDGPYNCGGNLDIFRSTAKRSYQKGIKEASCEQDNNLPEELAKNDIDLNNNAIPDYLDDLMTDENKRQEYAQNALRDFDEENMLEEDLNISEIEEYSLDDYTDEEDSEEDSKEEDLYGELEEIENLIDGFNCGFGGDSCFGLPINWAPLAPGNDPVVMGKLMGDGLKVDEGYPIFSTLTGLQMQCGHSPCCLPTVYPVSSKTFIPGPRCGGLGAGGALGADSATNFFRLFITPTLTGGAGVAACFGAPASVVGNAPPKGLNPVIPGGNCIVYAKKLNNVCKDSVNKIDTDIIGQVNYINDDISDGGGSTSFINGNCEFSQSKKLPATNKIDTTLAREFMKYLDTGVKTDSLEELYDNFARDITSDSNGVISFSPLSGSNGIGIDYSFNSGEGVSFKEVEEISNNMVPGFPDFIVRWVDDQLEQFITKLADFPTLYVIMPNFDNILKGYDNDYTNKLTFNKSTFAQTSGIKEVYEFLGNIPFVNIELEPININIPYLPSFEGTLKKYKAQLAQYENELYILKNEAGAEIKPENIIKIQKFQNSIKQNMQAIQSYMELPEKIANLAGKKEERLSQIMCYVDSMEEMTVGWMQRNGKRFKAWVQTYLLVKAALKSWQLLADIFIDYESECHECKNERYDSFGAQFKLVNMIIPSLPVVEFPKWPDVVLDLHNIRLGINLRLPDFKIAERQILLPPLPSLTLPSVSECINFDIELPEIPVLPMIQLQELPDLPPIKTVVLPDLPPPPRLPKMSGALTGILSIMKLVTKAMCILKKLPFVPEERAGDQIAFLTEGSGYRGFDFSVKIPALSSPGDIPFVDEIQVKTFVNLEMDVDYLTELSQAIVAPVNNMVSNFSNMFGSFNINMDFSGLCSDLKDEDYEDSLEDVGGGDEYEDSSDYQEKIEENFENTNKIKTPSSFKLNPVNLSKAFALGIQNVQKCIAKSSKNEVSAIKFLAFVNKQLSSDFILKDEKLDELRHSFDFVNNYTYSKEDKIIKNLEKQNLEKFEILKSIIKKEVKETKKLKEKIQKLNNSKYQKIINNNIDKEKLYNKAFKKYNENFIKAAQNLTNPSYFDIEGLKNNGKELKTRVHSGIKNFKKEYLSYNNSNNLAVVTPGNSEESGCSKKKSLYTRKYNGILITQKKEDKKITYKLFDYLGELDGKEEITPLDYDLDGDKDLLYNMNGNLYLKKNLLINPIKNHLSGIEVLDSSDNKFINGDVFHEAVNNVWESLTSNNYLNVSFSSSKDDSISNYRLTFYQIIDKYLNIGNNAYIPENIKKYIIDGISGGGIVNFVEQKENYKVYNNLAYIKEVGNSILKVSLTTKELKNISDSLKDGNVAIIQSGTKIYAGNTDVKINYLIGDGETENELKIKKHTNVEFEEGIKITKISGDAYIMSDKVITLKGSDIHSYNGLPITFDTRIKIFDNNFTTNSSSHITIKYYDKSEALLDFRKIKDYLLYDLGAKASNYGITLNMKNDYYYARMQNFKENIFGTKTSQILLSPQKQADLFAPDLDIADKIRIPVYQKREIDFTDSIYENSGLENIKEFKIEGLDESRVKINKTNRKISVEFGKFDTIFKKKIKFIVVDQNDNKTEAQVNFEVYTPIPQIRSISNTGAIIGDINEELTDEPINIYRVRGKLIKRIKTNSGATRVNTNTGKYLFDANLIKDNYLSITQSGAEIFKVNEYTGKITMLPFDYNIKAYPGKDNFINIGIYKGSDEVFRERINLEKIHREVEIVKDFNNLPKDGIFFKWISDEFDYYRLPKSVLFNPGAFVIYRKTDEEKTPIFVITPDSRVKIINDYYEMQYSYKGDYIVIKLFDKHFNKYIGEFLLKINNAFVIR